MTYSMKETSLPRLRGAAAKSRATQANSRVIALAASLSFSPLANPLGWQSVAIYAALSACAIATYAEFLHYALAAL
ncbi:MAG: hypothetical protein AAFP03_06900 [Cyanobacteria bacterium J06598_3]